MVIVEKSFPRGGTTTKETKAPERQDKIIFGALQKKIKKAKPKVRDGAGALYDDAQQDKVESVSAELLTYDTIQDDMIIMGVVKELDQLYLKISLPGRLIARVSALEISDAYTRATKEFLNQTLDGDKYKPLTDLYRKGQIVYGRVQEIKPQQRGRPQINMSLKPSEVHAELLHVNVKKGFIFNGAIEEVQEHGYIIESGIKGLRSFLPLEKTQAAHVVGELIFLKVEKITHDKAASTCVCKAVKAKSLKVKNQLEANLDYILPSAIVQFTVTKRVKDGLQGTIMNEAFTAYINEHQLAEPLALPDDYELNVTLNARVLYVMPLTKLVYLSLSLRNAVNAADNSAAEPHYKVGDVVEKAKVHHLGTGGVILVLNNRFKGLLSYRTIKANYKGNYDQDEMLLKYAKKTQHKVRVLDYDPMDCLYICTDDANTVNEKVFVLDDVNPGEFVSAVVKRREPKIGGYTMQLGRVKGIIEQLFLAPASKVLEENQKIRCRVVAVSRDRKTVYLTNRPEYLSKSCKVLSSLTDAQVNATYMGTIVKCHDNYLLVKFFNNLKGVLYKQRLSSHLGIEAQHFYEGQTMLFRIANKNGEQITLCLADDNFKMGEICPITVVNALNSGLEIKVAFNDEDETDNDTTTEAKGLIPIRLLSDHIDLLQAKLRMFPVDTTMQAACIVRNIFSVRDVPYFQTHLTNDWKGVKPGDVLKAWVKNVSEEVVELQVPVNNYERLVKVHLKMLLVSAYQHPNLMLSPEQVVYVKVLGKELATKTITVSAKLTDVWDCDLSATGLFVEQYLQEVADIKKAYKKLGHPLAQYTIGQKVKAQFVGIRGDNNDWQYDVVKTKVRAVVRPSIVGKSKTPAMGAQQECIVLWIDYSNELLFVSTKLSDITHINAHKEIPENLVAKSGINAKVLLKLENIFICSLKKGPNPLVYCPLRLHFNDFENSASAGIKEGDFCKLAFIHETFPIAVLESTWKLWHGIKRKRKAKVDEIAAVKVKKIKTATGVEEHDEEVFDLNATKQQKHKLVKQQDEHKTAPPLKKAKQEKSKEPQCSNTLFYEDKIPNYTPQVITQTETKQRTDTTTKRAQTEVKNLPGIGDFWTTDLTQLNGSQNDTAADSSDDDADAAAKQAAQKKKKLSATEKFKLQRDEEQRLRAIEEKLADPNQLPDSVDQFDRLVLSDPNNSKHWINYMVFHLQSAEIEKARAVARRAIKSISFRDGNEQLNMWVALLNLELRYGNKEAFDETHKEALTYNDPLKVYLRTLEILSDAKKTQELTEMLSIVTKKYKAQPEVWKAAANAYFEIGMADKAQQLLHKALACLPEREHVNTIVAFGLLNHKHGNNEMAQTLLDQVVTSYPKRVDVWAQYVDMLVKENLIDSARAVLERAIIQKIPLKKMRTIFKKYLDLEERFGSEADVLKVKQLATKYVKTNANL